MANTPAHKNVVDNIRSPALKYWQDEIATKGEATKEIYARNFTEFLKFVNMNADRPTIKAETRRHLKAET